MTPIFEPLPAVATLVLCKGSLLDVSGLSQESLGRLVNTHLGLDGNPILLEKSWLQLLSEIDFRKPVFETQALISTT